MPRSFSFGNLQEWRVFRTCSETVGTKPTETPFGFFGRAACEGDDSVAAGLTSKLAFHSKNQRGTTVSGVMNTFCQHIPGSAGLARLL